jgi:diguanylate cyclase (GGDEF)-like protein
MTAVEYPMTTPDKNGRRRRQTPRLLAPFALVVLSAFAACAIVGYVLARESDVHHQEQRRAALLGVVDEFRTVFADMTYRATRDLAVAGLGDARGLARALEPVGLARYSHERAAVIDAKDAVLAAFPHGSTMPAAVLRVVKDFRAGHADQGGAGASGSIDAGADAPVVTEVIMLDGAPALVAVAAVRAARVGEGAATRAPLLVRVKRLDAALFGAFERMSGVSGLAFDAAAPQDDRDVQSLLDPQGRIISWLSWKREHPTMDAVVRIVPLLGAVVACLVAFASMAIRQLGTATQQLAASEAEAHKIAYEDPVTGLPNRRMMSDLLDAALAEGAGASLALIDVDGFSDLRESLGEQGSDELLAAVGERLRAVMPSDVTLGRVGPSEFAFVVTEAEPAQAVAAAQAGVQVMARPLWVANQSVQTGVTMGLVHAPEDGDTREELNRRADLARRSLERGGSVRIAGFDPDMEQEFQDRLFIKRELRRALAEKGFQVYYQPIVAAEGQRIVGVEALLRWDHPARGMIPPSEFIPIAEQTGLMPQLGEFVLRRALADAVSWRDIYVAVNMSPNQMRDRGIVSLVAAVLADTGLPPERVMLEVTEGVLIDNPDEAKERLAQLRALGLKIALDDFGSGYSSLSYLRRFPIDKLKIDKEFVGPLGRSTDGGVIIQAIMALGRALGLLVLCEGVETEEQRILLRLAGCDEMQGYLFSKPVPLPTIERMITAQQQGTEARRASA